MHEAHRERSTVQCRVNESSRGLVLDRRGVLRAAAGLLAVGSRTIAADEPTERIMTVRGPIDASSMGVTLPHEHILVDFIGAAEVDPARYDRAEVSAIALPHLERIKSLAVGAFVDCTPAYLGRDPSLLRSLSERTGMHILTNTGYYGAAAEKYLPAHAKSETAHELAGRWLKEWRQGIDDTGIRPGFIKIGMDKGPISPSQVKLIRAAARTHRDSGLTIAAHTGDGAAAMEQLAILKEEGVSPSAWIWVHAQNEPDRSLLVKAARLGAWIELDGIGPDSIADHVRLLKQFEEQAVLSRVLLSHDAGWYHVGEPKGGRFRPFDTLQTRLIPALRDHGFSAKAIHTLVVDNPREAFAVRVRTPR